MTEPVLFKRSEGCEPSTWRAVNIYTTPTPLIEASCGHHFAIPNHGITESGDIYPIVRCPELGCGLTFEGTLEDYDLGKKELRK